MDTERQRKAQALFRVALDMARDERMTFLETVCPEDTTVRDEVERLIVAMTVDETADALPAVSTPVVPGTPLPGDRIDRYELLHKLGEGGMGIVFKAQQHEPIRRTVAFKVVKPGMDSAQVLARFEAERQALALMDHPEIAKVLDAGATERGHPYFVMDYVPGEPLTEYCDRQELGMHERLELFARVCDAVQHAHRKGVIHRDLKPSNILVHERDGAPQVKIIDFGIARAIDRRLTEQSIFEQFGTMIGTPEYMSPEQARGENIDIDTRTDVYSLGVVLYELLVGRRPFEVTELRKIGLEAIRQQIVSEDPAKPSTRLGTLGDDSVEVARHRHTSPGTLLREVQGDLDWITMRALEKERERRYDSASELARDVRRHLRSEPVSAGPPGLSYRTRKFVRRHRVGVGLVTLLSVSLILGATLSTIGFVRALRAESEARFEADTSVEVIEFLVGLFRISDPGEARGNAVTAREILDRGVDSIDAELTERPDLKGRLLEVMGRVYRSLGLYADSLLLFDGAIEDRRRANGGDGPELADALSAKAGTLLLLGRAEDAQPLLEEALEIQNRRLAPDDGRRARTMNNLGTVARMRSDKDQALEWFRQALEIRERALGPESPELIRSLSNIGSLYSSLGNETAALEAYGRALDIATRSLPADHPDLARLLNNRGNVHRRAGRYAEARADLRRALELREQVLEPDHPDLVNSLRNLGSTLFELGEYPEADRLLDRALVIAERGFGPDHSRVRVVLESRVPVLEALGRVDDASRARERIAALTGE